MQRGPLGRRQLRGVLLDLDGTLLHSEPLHRAFATTPGRWTGKDPDALVAEVLGHLADTDTWPAPIQGAPELIRSWHARGVSLALVTSAARAWAEYAVEEILGVRECFAALVTAEDVTQGKPHPAPYAAGCRALHLKPADATAIEDSVAGVTAAVAAGVGRVVGLTATTDGARLREAGAHQVVSALGDLAAH